MKRVQIVPAARQDLEQTARWILTEDPQAAVRYLEGLDKTFRLLAERPLLGKECDLYRVGMRSFVHKRHLIFYRPASFGVTILRVLHERRDLDREFSLYAKRRSDEPGRP